MTKEELKQYIDDNIYENVGGDISGDSLNEVLKAIVDDGGTEVEANPTGTPTVTLEKIKIGETIYEIPDPNTSDLVTEQELQQGLATKQDAIDDLQTIRNGANAGATAIQGVKVNETELTPDANKKVNIRFQDIVGGLAYGGIVGASAVLTPDTSCYYITNGAGTYTAFGGVQVSSNDHVQILTYDGTQWQVTDLPWYTYSYAHGKFDLLNVMAGATDSAPGVMGFVPAPAAGDQDKILQGNGQWVPKPSDGQDGADGDSAYQIAVDNGFVGTEEQWLASLKANIGAFQFITQTDTTAEAALTTIGSTYASAIGGVSPLQSTLSIILLMNDSNNTKTMMIATQETATAGVYEFVYAGDLQSAMPSNVLTEDDVDNTHLDNPASGALALAEDVKELKDDLYGSTDLVEGEDISSQYTQTQCVFNNYTSSRPDAWYVHTSGSIKTNVIALSQLIQQGLKKLKITAPSDNSKDCCYTFVKKVPLPSEQSSYQTLVDGGYLCGVHDAKTSVVKNIAYGTTETIDVPQDAVAIYFQIMTEAGTSRNYPSSIIPVVQEHTDGDIDELRNIVPITTEKMANAAVTTPKIADAAVTVDKVDFIYDIVGKNKCNPEDPDFKLNAAVRWAHGDEVQTVGDKYGVTGYIPVTQNGLVLNHPNSRGTAFGWCAYDSNKQWIEGRGVKNSGTYTYVDGDAFVRFTFKYEYRNKIQVEEGSVVSEYEPYTVSKKLDPRYQSLNIDASELEILLNSIGFYKNTVELSLPDKIWAVRGDKLQIFYQGIVICPNIELYDITVICSKGKGLYRYYEFDVPSDEPVGETDWTIIVKDANGSILASKTCKLAVVDKAETPTDNKNVLFVGASFISGGIIPAETKRRLTGEVGTGTPPALGLTKISFIGRQSKQPAGLPQVNLEGNSGWGWIDYATYGRPRYRFYLRNFETCKMSKDDIYTNNGKSYKITEINAEDGGILTSSSTSGNTIVGNELRLSSGASESDSVLYFDSYAEQAGNPFWDATANGGEGSLSFIDYVENSEKCNLPSGTLIDYAYFLLVFNTSPEWNEDWSEYIGYAKDVIDALHRDYPSCKVKLLGAEFVYPPTFVSGTSQQMTMNTVRRVAKANELYQELANSDELSGVSGDAYNVFVEFVNVSSQFDSKYNMNIINSQGNPIEKDANTRNSTFKEIFVGNSIHPGRTGYLQIADVAYRNICKDLS